MPVQESDPTTTQAKEPALDFAPGELEPFDYSTEEMYKSEDLDEKVVNELQTLCRHASKRDVAARRMEVEQAWEARLFKRGYQYLFPRRGGGWSLTSPLLGGRSWSDICARNYHETNIYGAHCDILTAALTRDIPACRFEPFNPNYSPDITAAEKAEDFKEIFARNNDLRQLHTRAADYMCTDGRVLFYTRMVLDGQRFGFEDPEDENPVAPEDEVTGAPDSPNVEEGQEEARTENESPVQGKRKPRGREITDCFGKLEHKVPLNTRDIHDMDFIQLFWDVHISKAKARFPWIAGKIEPGSQGVAEIELDRIARINCALALEGSYVTADTFNREVTIQYTWLRPAEFMAASDAVKGELFDKFPDGVLVVYAGETFAFARNESMDDHLHVLQCFPGSGQNRIALMSKVLSIQKRLNNWIDLLNDFFIRTVPQKWMDTNAFNVEAIQQRNNIPGGVGPFQRQPGVPVSELIFIEPTPTHQPTLPEFIQFFFNDYPQMLSGALPSLFGAESNTDTATGISIQRDQALGRLASPWSALQTATAMYHQQAVGCAAECRAKLGQMDISESVPGKGKVSITVDDLKGRVLCFPEADQNFPETWIQKSSRWQQIMTEAGTNPLTLKMLSIPKNMKAVKDGIGLQELEIPESDSVDKQLGEFEILLKTGPVPNPQVAQAQQQFEQAAMQAAQAGEGAQFAQVGQQALQQIQSLPQQVSTVPVAQDASEDHDTEAETCKEWLNSAEGRKFKNGTPEERASWENVHLHWSEHMAMSAKLKAGAAGPPKPPSGSVSAAVDKMPPNVASQFLEKYYGIQAGPKDFMEQDAADVEAKITEKSADYGRGVPPNSGTSGAEVQ